jgi:ribosome-associated toxin RatA of RatAB toxin-antitoxin module
MSTIKVTRQIKAPVEEVFRTVSDIRNFSKAVPDIVDVEFLSETKSGVGTKFKETREFKGRKAATVLEVTEYVENDYIRIVSDTQGTIWDSLFTVTDKDGGCELTLEMESRPYKFLSKILTPFMKNFINKALERDMDAVKEYCEN